MVLTKQELFRTKLDQKIFNSDIAKTVTIIKKSTPVYNDRDEVESYTESETTTDVVPYDLIQGRYSVQPWAKLAEGDGQIVFRYSVDVDIDDLVEIESIRYKVVDVDPNYLPESIAKICTLSRMMGSDIL